MTTLKHAIYGKIELNNGRVMEWLRFVDGTMDLSDAIKEGVRLVAAQHGDATKKCWPTHCNTQD